MSKKLNLGFEEAMQKLEDSVTRLELSNLTLDESISEFENAVSLIKFCEEKLNTAKQTVKILTEDADGIVTDMPFAAENDNAT